MLSIFLSFRPTQAAKTALSVRKSKGKTGQATNVAACKHSRPRKELFKCPRSRDHRAFKLSRVSTSAYLPALFCFIFSVPSIVFALLLQLPPFCSSDLGSRSGHWSFPSPLRCMPTFFFAGRVELFLPLSTPVELCTTGTMSSSGRLELAKLTLLRRNVVIRTQTGNKHRRN